MRIYLFIERHLLLGNGFSLSVLLLSLLLLPLLLLSWSTTASDTLTITLYCVVMIGFVMFSTAPSWKPSRAAVCTDRKTSTDIEPIAATDHYLSSSTVIVDKEKKKKGKPVKKNFSLNFLAFNKNLQLFYFKIKLYNHIYIYIHAGDRPMGTIGACL